MKDPSPARVLALLAATLVLSPVIAELALRALRGDGFVNLPIYTSTPSGLALAPGATATGLLADRAYTVAIDARGLRAPAPAGGTLLLGDSLAFGLGVDGADTFAALATAAGHPVLNAAAPGFDIPDAVARGAALAEDLDPTAILVLVNPADDGGPAIATRTVVADGWLLPAGAPGWARNLFASPLSRWHVPHELARAALLASGAGTTPAAPAWHDSPTAAAAAMREVGALVAAFSVSSRIPVTAAWGGNPAEWEADPARRSALAAAKVALRDSLGPVALLDLSEPLIACDECYLADGVHWSPEGHRRVAAALR